MDLRCVSSRDLDGFVQIGAVEHVDRLEALRQRPQAVEGWVVVEAIARRLAADLLLTPARAPQARHIVMARVDRFRNVTISVFAASVDPSVTRSLSRTKVSYSKCSSCCSRKVDHEYRCMTASRSKPSDFTLQVHRALTMQFQMQEKRQRSSTFLL